MDIGSSNPPRQTHRQLPMRAAGAVRDAVGIVAYALAASILCGVWAPLAALANPSGENVVAGQGSFDRSGSTLTVMQNTDRMIVNWQQFSINPWETTRFVQPSVHSAALNRVVGGDPSNILGSLQANGSIYLINPNGIVVGSGARIDAGSFLASTLDVSDAQFMAGGAMNFLGPSTATVKNLGVINATNGDVVLIAQEVQNHGEINAPNGTAGLASGNDIVLTPTSGATADGQRLSVRVKESDLGIRKRNNGITNTGKITAATAELKAAGGNVYALAINNTGVIRANSLQNRGGRIFLGTDGGKIANYGTLQARGGKVVMNSASRVRTRAKGSPGSSGSTLQAGIIDVSNRDAGQKGGTAQVLGDQVFVTRNARMDASGHSGGGTILVGGDFQGSNADVVNAEIAFIDAGAQLHADATASGNGGKIVVWSNKVTTIGGATITAEGGPDGGNGGLIETSGKQSLVFAPREISVLARSGTGKDGVILLDPENIYIEPSYCYNDNYEVMDGEVLFQDGYYYYPVSFTITGSALSVLSGNVLLQATDSIYVNDVVNFTSATRAVFQAGNSIYVNKNMSASGGEFVLIAGSAVPDFTSPSEGPLEEGPMLMSLISLPPVFSHTLSLASGVSLKSNGGDISLNAQIFDLQGKVDAGTGTVYVGRFPGDLGDLSMIVGDSGLNASAISNITGGQVVFGKAKLETAPMSGVFSFITASELTTEVPLILTSPSTFIATGNILLNSIATGQLTVSAGGAITQSMGTTLSGKNLELTAGSGITLANIEATNLLASAGESIIQLAGSTITGESITLKSAAAVTLANVQAANLVINAGSFISQLSSGGLQAEFLTLLAGSAISLENTGNNIGQIVAVEYSAASSIYSAGSTLLSGSVNGHGSFSLISATNLTLGSEASFNVTGSGSIVSLAALGDLTIENASVLLNIAGGALFNLYSSTEAGANLDGLTITNGLNFVVYNNQQVLNPNPPAGDGVFFGSAAPPAPQQEFDYSKIYTQFLAAEAQLLQSDLPEVNLEGKVYIYLTDGSGNFTRYEVIAAKDESFLLDGSGGIFKISNQKLLQATQGAMTSQIELLLNSATKDPSSEFKIW